jgi:hypothetical protein
VKKSTGTEKKLRYIFLLREIGCADTALITYHCEKINGRGEKAEETEI